MKKITLLLAMAVAVVFSASAQKNALQHKEGVNLNTKFSVSHSDAKTTTYDTIWPNSIEGGCDSLRLYGTQNGGYFTGNNEYGFTEVGTLVKYAGNGSLTSVEAILYRGGTVGSGTCQVNVYSKGTDLYPSTLLGTSETVPVSLLTTEDIAFVPFTFATPIAVTSDFFVTVVLPTNTGDSIAVVSTSEYCSAGTDSMSIIKYNGSFVYYKTAADIDIDLFISAAVTTTTGIADAAIENVNVFSANNEIVIENNNKSIIKQVSVYNTLGQEVKKFEVNSNETTRLTCDLPASNYISDN
jgi:hypothetical protein